MRNLYATDSNPVHLNLGELHLRRLRKEKGTEALQNYFKTPFDNFKNKLTELEEVQTERRYAGDDVDFNDIQLDHQVRIVFGTIVNFDLKKDGKPILTTIFPDGKFGDIIGMPREDEPAEVEKIDRRLADLGQTHELFPLAAQLRDRKNAVKESIVIYRNAKDKETVIAGELELTREKLRAAYEENYLEAWKQFGKQKAESFFSHNA